LTHEEAQRQEDAGTLPRHDRNPYYGEGLFSDPTMRPSMTLLAEPSEHKARFLEATAPFAAWSEDMAANGAEARRRMHEWADRPQPADAGDWLMGPGEDFAARNAGSRKAVAVLADLFTPEGGPTDLIDMATAGTTKVARKIAFNAKGAAKGLVGLAESHGGEVARAADAGAEILKFRKPSGEELLVQLGGEAPVSGAAIHIDGS